jgi:hypothetical protein
VDSRKVFSPPHPLNNSLLNPTPYDQKYASVIEEKYNSPIISATYKKITSTLLSIDDY